MNTTPTPESSSSDQPNSPDFSQVTGADPSPKDEALAALEKDLEGVKDARVEERFLWIIAMVILVDVIWFENSPNPAFPIVILVLELIALIILGRRMGVSEATRLLERILQGIGQRGQGGGG
jgi:hypothetical protein